MRWPVNRMMSGGALLLGLAVLCAWGSAAAASDGGASGGVDSKRVPELSGVWQVTHYERAIRTVDGTYIAFGQKLTIDRGRVIFDGPPDNPALDVVALRKNLAVEAGIEITGSLAELSFEQIDAVVRTNLLGTITLTKLVLPSMLERRAGVVVNVASLAGKAGMPYNSIYSTTKHGLIGFTEALDLELDGTGVRAGAVLPGFVSETGMWADAHDRAPFLLREVPPSKVVAAVFKVIDGAPEAVVSSLPIRPLLALWAVAPALKKPMVKQMGLLRLMRKEAARPAARPSPAQPAVEATEAAMRE